MTKLLPANPNLSSLKKQAKQLLRQYHDGVKEAVTTVQSFHPHPDKFKSLRDAQLVIARSYNYQGWIDLNDAVELAVLNNLNLTKLADEFLDLACLSYRPDDSERRRIRARNLLENNPGLSKFNLITAIVSLDLSHVEQLLTDNPDLVSQKFSPRDWEPLTYLTYSRLTERNSDKVALKLAECLLRHGADANAYFITEHNYRFSVLTGAMGEGEGGLINQPPHQYAKELATILLDAGSDPNDSQGLYNTMFTPSGDFWLERFVSYGLNDKSLVNWANENEACTMFNYLLETAIDRNFLPRIKYLLSLGANPNAKCHYSDRTIYTTALTNGLIEIIDELEKAGAVEVNLKEEDHFLISILHRDVQTIKQLIKTYPNLLSYPKLLEKATCEILQTLIGAGFNVNQQDEHGLTLLHVMARTGRLDCVTYLLDQGADPEHRDNNYQGKAVGHAHFHQQFEVRDYLLNRFDYVIESSACGHLAQIKKSLAKDPMKANSTGLRGNTALHVLCSWLENPSYEECEAIVDLLIENSADINAENENGQTPLQFNIQENDEDNISLLRAKGAR